MENASRSVDIRSPRLTDIRAVQLEHSYGALGVGLFGSLMVAVLLVLLLSGQVDRYLLVLWLLVLVLVTAARAATMVLFRRTPKQARGTRAWAGWFTAGCCAAGLAWAAAALWLFAPTSFMHQVLLAFALGGMVAGAVPLLAFTERNYACFALPIIVAISARNLALGDHTHLFMGLMMLIYGFTMLLSARQMAGFFGRSVRLQLKLKAAIKSERALTRMLRLDALTGVASRRNFDEMLDREWRRAQREGGSLSLIIADVDHFKAFNDRYGHVAGDKCLHAVAQAMQGALRRPGDLVARIGGEEFAVLLPATPTGGAAMLAEQMRRAVSELDLTREVPDLSGPVTISLGVANSEAAAIGSPQELHRAADQSLYNAKHGGRNRVAVARPD